MHETIVFLSLWAFSLAALLFQSHVARNLPNYNLGRWEEPTKLPHYQYSKGPADYASLRRLSMNGNVM